MPMLWYGAGDTRIDPRAFEQLDKDSDRAAGLVAAAIVEQRLEEAIQFWMVADSAVQQSLFRPSGALGAFGVKIDLAYLMGVISSAGRSDLIILKSIRNDFAHRLELDSFEIPTIRDRCANLRLVDTLIREPSPSSPFSGSFVAETPEGKITHLGHKGITEDLAHARQRYVLAAQLFGYLLGRGVYDKDQSKPYF